MESCNLRNYLRLIVSAQHRSSPTSRLPNKKRWATPAISASGAGVALPQRLCCPAIFLQPRLVNPRNCRSCLFRHVHFVLLRAGPLIISVLKIDSVKNSQREFVVYVHFFCCFEGRNIIIATSPSWTIKKRWVGGGDRRKLQSHDKHNSSRLEQTINSCKVNYGA